MKEMKRILALVLSFVMLVGVLPLGATEAKAAEVGSWVTITEPAGGTTTYTYTQADSITGGGKYVIVGNNHAVALMDNRGSIGSQAVTIDGNTMTSTTALTEWTFSGNVGGTVYSGSNYLAFIPVLSYYTLISTRETLVFTDNGSNFRIYYDGLAADYSLYYNGSSWTDSTSNNYVRLFQLTGSETSGGTPGLYAKLDGNATYTVARGTTAEEALAVVKEGITVLYHNGDENAALEYEDDGEGMSWVLDRNYDGTVVGEYSVTVSYNGIELGTVKVIVPEVAVVGYDCQTSGSVRIGASGNVRTGANITVNLDDGSSYTVPVTVNMLSGAFNTNEAGTYTGLTVTYNGQVVCENFTLTVRAPSSYPEYPDEGAVKVNKTATGVEFQSTGVTQVEVSASGIPMNQGVDILLILDTSSSMRMQGSLNRGTRIDVLEACVDALIKNLKAEREDGSVPDVEIAVVDFNGYFGNKRTNYIGSTARDTTTIGGVLTDGWVNIQNLPDNWGTAGNIPENGSGTNYDHGLQQAYELLLAKQQQDNGTRKQFVLFMSDGAPFQYNGVNSNSGGNDWENWILGSYTQAQVNNISTLTNPEFYAGNNNGNGQKHRIAEAIKGSADEDFNVVFYNGTNSSATASLTTVKGLGATMYSVGLALEGTNMPTNVAGQEAILKTIASSEDVFYSVTSAEGLQEAFDDFAGEALMAATNARFVDQMGDAYDLHMGPIVDVDGNVVDFENKIEIISYDIYTRADYLAGEVTADRIGDRKGTSTVLETVTFSADGTEVYSDQDSVGPNGETLAAGSNILIDGIIYAANFWYNSNLAPVEIDGVDIPTGTDSNGLTTGSTNVLPAETFYWKVGTIRTTELAMRYCAYLTGSMEGTREAGSFATNNYANLYYDNYLNQPAGQPCQKGTTSPIMAWKEANVSYAFYLVDAEGNIVVNQTTGQTGSFANKVAVTNPVVYQTVLLNNKADIQASVVAKEALPVGYTLYDEGASYSVTIKSSGMGGWEIVQTKEPATTYVSDFGGDPNYSNLTSENATHEYTHTVVWFAVVWQVQALPDTVVLDYGLPVDISVLTNDMFGENGKLTGVGSVDALPADYDNVHTENMTVGFGDSYTGEYGTADIDSATGKVRYTLNGMQMNTYEKFAYAAQYTGNKNPGYYYDTVTVIPATTIYYEDSFITLDSYTWSDGWQKVDGSGIWSQEGTTVDGVQAEDRPGQYSLTDANNIYGYDAANKNMSTFSMGSAVKAVVDYNNKGTAAFEFYGTGFDVFSMTSNTTGAIYVDIYQDDALLNSYMVDTYYGYDRVLYHVTYTFLNGSWFRTKGEQAAEGTPVQNAVRPENPTEGQQVTGVEVFWEPSTDADNSLYQVPVIQVKDLAYGKYKVEITATYSEIFDHVDPSNDTGSYEFYLDAVRVYDPTNDGAADGSDDTTIEDAYVDDHEGWPSYIELRDQLIAAGTLGNADTATVINGMVFIDGIENVGDAQIQDYISYGPNNEVYLAPGQSVAFILNTPANIDKVHLGVKSADGKVGTYTITNIARAANAESGVKPGDHYGEKTATMDTATDMYYDITGYKNDIIVVTNTGDMYDTDGIIALTNIKSTYTSDPGSAAAQVAEPANFETFIYMTPEIAGLTVSALNAMEEESQKPAAPEEPKPQKVDTTVLAETIKQAQTYMSKDYTKDSYKALQDALKEARKVLKSKTATQVVVDDAVADLLEAVEDLVPVVESKPVHQKPAEGKLIGRLIEMIGGIIGLKP